MYCFSTGPRVRCTPFILIFLLFRHLLSKSIIVSEISIHLRYVSSAPQSCVPLRFIYAPLLSSSTIPISPSARPHTGVEREMFVSPDVAAHDHVLHDVRQRKFSRHCFEGRRGISRISFFNICQTPLHPLFPSLLLSPFFGFACAPTQPRTRRYS